MKSKNFDPLRVLTIVAIVMVIILAILFFIGFMDIDNNNKGMSPEEKQEILDSLAVGSANISKAQQDKILNSLKSDTKISQAERESILNSLKVK